MKELIYHTMCTPAYATIKHGRDKLRKYRRGSFVNNKFKEMAVSIIQIKY